MVLIVKMNLWEDFKSNNNYRTELHTGSYYSPVKWSTSFPNKSTILSFCVCCWDFWSQALSPSISPLLCFLELLAIPFNVLYSTDLTIPLSHHWHLSVDLRIFLLGVLLTLLSLSRSLSLSVQRSLLRWTGWLTGLNQGLWLIASCIAA